MQYDIDAFYANANCTAAINPVTLGYDPTTDGNTFTL
jgi:hypothetical protein